MTDDEALDAPELAAIHGQVRGPRIAPRPLTFAKPPSRKQLASKLQDIILVLNAQSEGVMNLHQRLEAVEAQLQTLLPEIR